MPALTLRGTSSPIITTDGSVIAGFSNGIVVSVAAEDGVWSWEERVAVPDGEYDIERVIDVDGDLLLDGTRILASSYQGNIMAFDILTGRIVWGMEAFGQAIQLAPERAEYHHNLGLIYHRNQLLSAAEKSFRAALERQPGLAAGHYNLGNHHCNNACTKWCRDDYPCS